MDKHYLAAVRVVFDLFAIQQAAPALHDMLVTISSMHRCTACQRPSELLM